MLHQFSPSHDKGQSMVIHPKYMQYALSVVCQLSSPNDIGQSKVIPPQVSDMPHQMSSSELGYTSPRYEIFCRFSSSSMMIPYQV